MSGTRLRSPVVLMPTWRAELAGAATAFHVCAKERSMKQTNRRYAKHRRARSACAIR